MSLFSLHYSVLVFLLVANALIAVTAIFSNVLVLFTISRTSSLRIPSNILILGLSMSDLCCGAFSQPWFFAALVSAVKEDLHFFHKVIWMYYLSLTIIGASSFLILTSITIDRFLALLLHLRYKEIVTSRRCYVTLFCILVCSISVGLCRELVKKKETLRVLTVLSVLLFLSLLLLNAYLIFKISRVIRRHSLQIQAQQQSVQQSIDMPRYKKSVNTMYYVIGAFVLCYVPYAIVYASTTAIRKLFQPNYVYAIAETLVMLNGVLNPIIYCWRIKELRVKAIKSLMKIFRSKAAA